MNISVVISTYNRADSLSRTLSSVKKLAKEIIVVDNSSTDTTSEIAKKYGAKVYTRPNNLMLNVNKNFGFTKATEDWILCLDDDEEIPPELAREIKALAADSPLNGYWIPRKNIIFGKWIRHGIWWPDRQLRLFKKGTGKYPQVHVHEYIEIAGSAGVLETPYVHYNYDSLSQYLDKMQHIYTENEIQKYISSGYRISWRDAIRFPASDFIKLYFAQSGYKDGLHGLVLALLQAFYSFIIFVKLWERDSFREIDIHPTHVSHEFNRTEKDMTYWITTMKMRETSHPIFRLWYRLVRRIMRTP